MFKDVLNTKVNSDKTRQRWGYGVNMNKILKDLCVEEALKVNKGRHCTVRVTSVNYDKGFVKSVIKAWNS